MTNILLSSSKPPLTSKSPFQPNLCRSESEGSPIIVDLHKSQFEDFKDLIVGVGITTVILVVHK